MPSWVLSSLGIWESAAGASVRLDVVALLSASPAQAVDLGMSLTEALCSFSFNLPSLRPTIASVLGLY